MNTTALAFLLTVGLTSTTYALEVTATTPINRTTSQNNARAELSKILDELAKLSSKIDGLSTEQFNIRNDITNIGSDVAAINTPSRKFLQCSLTKTGVPLCTAINEKTGAIEQHLATNNRLSIVSFEEKFKQFKKTETLFKNKLKKSQQLKRKKEALTLLLKSDAKEKNTEITSKKIKDIDKKLNNLTLEINDKNTSLMIEANNILSFTKKMGPTTTLSVEKEVLKKAARKKQHDIDDDNDDIKKLVKKNVFFRRDFDDGEEDDFEDSNDL